MNKAASHSHRTSGLDELSRFIYKALESYSEPELGAGEPWWSPLWHVVRQSKAHPLLQNLDGIESWNLVQQAVEIKAFMEADSRLLGEEDVAVAWARGWDKVFYLPDETLLDVALREANENPAAPPRERTKGYARFLSVCAALCRLCGHPEISIGVERWGELLGVRPMTVSDWRVWGVQDGVLEVTREHSHAARRAREYRVRGDRLTMLRGAL